MSDRHDPKSRAAFLIGVFGGFGVGAVVAVVLAVVSPLLVGDAGAARIGNTVAIKWGDPISPGGATPVPISAEYGMHVFVTPTGPSDLGPFDVHAVCYIGRPDSVAYQDNIGMIGSAVDWADASARFGVIRFTSEGAYVGDGVPAPDGSENDFLYPTKRMTTHR